MRLWQWLVALVTLLFGRCAGAARGERDDQGEPDEERIVAAGTPERGAENVVLALLGLARVCSRSGSSSSTPSSAPPGCPTSCSGSAWACAWSASAPR